MYFITENASAHLISADLTPGIVEQIISEKWKFLSEKR